MNALFDVGIAEDGLFNTKTVMREMGFRSASHSLSLVASREGACTASVNGTTLGEEDTAINAYNIMFQWRTGLGVPRKTLGMGQHLVHAHLSIQTSQLAVDLYCVEFAPRHGIFHFVDVDVQILDQRYCPGGVWGRTSCAQNSLPLNASDYLVRTGRTI